MVREVAYQTLTKLVRAQRHAGTASVMAHMSNAPIDQVAHHAATAAELVAEIGPVPGVPPNISDQAVRLLLAAAQRALDVGAINQAQRHATRALDLGPTDAARRTRAVAAAGRGVDRAAHGEHRRAIDAEAALAAALIAEDRRHEGRARRLLGTLEQRTGNLDAARIELGTSVELFRELGDDIELATSLRERGFIEVFGGSLERRRVAAR